MSFGIGTDGQGPGPLAAANRPRDMRHRLLEALGNRRRLARLALLLGALLVAGQVWSHLPQATEIELVLGPDHRRIVEVRAAYLQQGEELHGVSLSFPDGAPAVVRHRVELSPGRYRLQVELRRSDGKQHTVVGEVVAPAEGKVRIPAR